MSVSGVKDSGSAETITSCYHILSVDKNTVVGVEDE